MAKANRWQMALPDILAEQLGAHVGAQAADLWLAKYASDPGPNVIGFMREVSQALQFDARQRNALRTAVHRARTGSTAGPQTTAPEFRAGSKVAVALLTAIRNKLIARTGRPPAEFIEDLGHLLGGRDGLQEMAAPALGWIIQGGRIPELSFDQLTDLVHKVYIALCHTVGPVPADEIFYKAVEHAKALPEAEQFPPTNLIFTDKA